MVNIVKATKLVYFEAILISKILFYIKNLETHQENFLFFAAKSFIVIYTQHLCLE